MKKSIKILVRLDDACPYMNIENWTEIENILDSYEIKPMVGIIPQCEDSNLMEYKHNPYFWNQAVNWQKKGWAIALHGFNHKYLTQNAGINPLWRRSEFAGVPLEIQREKIRQGYSILESNGLVPNYFFAPSHTFDENTVTAILQETRIKVISDTWALKPYKNKGMIFIPQQVGHFYNFKLSGYWTVCFHPNTMNKKQIEEFKRFIDANKDSFLSFDQVDLTNIGRKDLLSRILSSLYFIQRRIRGKV